MNKIITIALLAILAMACTTEKVGLEKLKSDREVLHREYAALGDEISQLDAEISKYDTTKRHVLITTTPVITNTFAHFFEVQGAIRADKNVILYPEFGGIIKRIKVNEGDRVQKGQVLMELDIELIQLQINDVKTGLDLAETTYQRQKRLWEQKIGSEMQYLQAKNQKETLENQLASLKAQMKKNSIVAPFAGVVDEIWPKEGELTSPMTQALRLVNLDEVHIKADVSEAYLGKVSRKTDVEIYFPAFDKTIKAQIDYLGNVINPNNRTFKIHVNVSNKENNIKPNLMAYVRVKDFEQENAIIVPDRLIQENPSGGKFVYVARARTGLTSVKKVMIKTGLTYLNNTLVTSGIEASSILVDKGARSVKDGQKVQVVN